MVVGFYTVNKTQGAHYFILEKFCTTVSLWIPIACTFIIGSRIKCELFSKLGLILSFLKASSICPAVKIFKNIKAQLKSLQKLKSQNNAFKADLLFINNKITFCIYLVSRKSSTLLIFYNNIPFKLLTKPNKT